MSRIIAHIFLFSIGIVALTTCKKKDYDYTFMPTYIYGIDISVERALLYIDDELHTELEEVDGRVSICDDADLEQCYYVELPFDCHNFEVRDHHGKVLVSHPLKFTKTRLKNCSPFDDKVNIEVGGNYGWILSTVVQDENDRHTCLMEFSSEKQGISGFADISSCR